MVERPAPFLCLLAGPAVGGCWGGGSGFEGGLAGGKFGLFLGLDAVGAEDAFDFGDFGLVGGVAGGAEPIGPVREGGEFFAPAGEVELDLGLMVMVPQGVDGLVGAVGGGAGILVKMGFFGDTGDGGVLFDVENGVAILAGGLDVFAVEMVAPHVAVDAHGLVDAAGELRLQVLHQLRDAPFSQRFEDEVDVVGHEAEGVDPDPVAAGQPVEAAEVGDELGAGLEDFLLAAAALVDVIDLADDPVALAGRGR